MIAPRKGGVTNCFQMSKLWLDTTRKAGRWPLGVGCWALGAWRWALPLQLPLFVFFPRARVVSVVVVVIVGVVVAVVVFSFPVPPFPVPPLPSCSWSCSPSRPASRCPSGPSLALWALMGSPGDLLDTPGLSRALLLLF